MSLPTCPSCVYAAHKCGKTGVTISRSTGCTFYEPKPQTNADRIRAMSDEELAEWATDDFCELLCGSTFVCDGDCSKKLLEWLKKDVSDG